MGVGFQKVEGAALLLQFYYGLGDEKAIAVDYVGWQRITPKFFTDGTISPGGNHLAACLVFHQLSQHAENRAGMDERHVAGKPLSGLLVD